MAWQGIEQLHDNNCPECGKDTPVIFLPIDVLGKIKGALMEYEREEWMAVLNGKMVDIGRYEIESMRIPKQEKNHSSVDPLEPISNSFGIMHSHNTMGGKFHSSDDVMSAGSFVVSITVNNDMEFDAKVRVMLPCKRYMLVNAKVMFNYPIIPLTEEEKALILDKPIQKFVSHQDYTKQTTLPIPDENPDVYRYKDKNKFEMYLFDGRRLSKDAVILECIARGCSKKSTRNKCYTKNTVYGIMGRRLLCDRKEHLTPDSRILESV